MTLIEMLQQKSPLVQIASLDALNLFRVPGIAASGEDVREVLTALRDDRARIGVVGEAELDGVRYAHIRVWESDAPCVDPEGSRELFRGYVMLYDRFGRPTLWFPPGRCEAAAELR